jgi:ATP-dependent exoDNAse (exonuclease V) beta subunit
MSSQIEAAQNPAEEVTAAQNPEEEREAAQSPEEEVTVAQNPEEEREAAQNPEEEREVGHNPDEEVEAAQNPKEGVKAMASMRLACQDLSDKQKQVEEWVKKVDTPKAAQIEQLGMCFGGEILNFLCGSGFSDLLRQHRGPDSP